jgi:hypothetical protein
MSSPVVVKSNENQVKKIQLIKGISVRGKEFHGHFTLNQHQLMKLTNLQ